MSKRSRKISKNQEKPDLIKGLADLSLEEIIALQKTAPILLQSKLQQISTSGDTEALMKANLYMDASSRGDAKMKSVFFDPNDVGDAGREYKETKGILPFETLRRMGDIFIVRSVVNTRVEQVQNFLHFSIDEQKAGYTIRKKRQLFHKEGMSQEIEKADQKKIEYIVNFLENGGLNEKWANFDSFQDFGRKLIFDSLTLDQMAFEITRDRGQDLARFRAIDASLIRLLDSADPKMRASFEKYRYKGYLPRFCMAWQGQILQNPTTKEHVVYYPWELGYGIRNKSTSIYRNGYGTSELETLVEIITWMLWGFQYNGNFFCISENSLIETEEGFSTVKDLVDKESFNVNTGKGLAKAKAFKTRIDDLYETRLWNGLKVETSKEHRFLTMTEEIIEPVWKRQEELTVNDYCLIGSEALDFKNNLEVFNIGKPYKTYHDGYQFSYPFTPTEEMINDVQFWEMMGFAIGDGNWGVRRLEIYPHWKKDAFLFERFSSVCEKYGLNYRVKDINKHIQRSDGIFGYPILAIFSTNFMSWLSEIGFEISSKKVVPLCVFNLKKELRGAFLRGWFSADGYSIPNIAGYKTPTLCCVNPELRQGALKLLLSLGVSCREKIDINKRSYNGTPIEIYIQDVRNFVESVGYLQDYKNENLLRADSSKSKWDLVPVELAKFLIEQTKPIRFDNTRWNVLKGKSRVSRGKLMDLFELSGLPVPEILKYHFVKYESSKPTKQSQQLYDIEVFNEEHIFLCDGVAVHNCKGSQPKGFINIKNANIDNTSLNEFRQAWTQTMRGVNNAHRTPILQGIDMEWIDLQKLSNRDMEFNEWVKFLIIITCSVYRIDPSELGFQFKEQANVFGQDGQKERLEHSKDKGLKPLLVFFQSVVNKYLVEEIDADFEFAFTGIEVEDEAQQVDLDRKKTEAGFVSFESMFEKYSGRPYDEEKDTILNAQFQSAQQMKQQAEMYAEPMPGEEGGEEDPFAQYKSVDNPILGAGLDYIQQHWGKK